MPHGCSSPSATVVTFRWPTTIDFAGASAPEEHADIVKQAARTNFRTLYLQSLTPRFSQQSRRRGHRNRLHAPARRNGPNLLRTPPIG